MKTNKIKKMKPKNSSKKNMDKVKIKRVKRNKKKITTKEKILAGLGLGTTLLGGMGAVKPQANTKQIVSTQSKEASSLRKKIAKGLESIIGIPKAKADNEGTISGGVSPINQGGGGGGAYTGGGYSPTESPTGMSGGQFEPFLWRQYGRWKWGG